MRVSTELVDAHNYNTMWADSYDRDLTDIFAIQSEISQTVASKLRAQLSPEERKDIEQKPTDNLEAYDLYLQAKQLIDTTISTGSMKEPFSKAISLLEQATQKDRKFALASRSIRFVERMQPKAFLQRILRINRPVLGLPALRAPPPHSTPCANAQSSAARSAPVCPPDTIVIGELEYWSVGVLPARNASRSDAGGECCVFFIVKGLTGCLGTISLASIVWSGLAGILDN